MADNHVSSTCAQCARFRCVKHTKDLPTSTDSGRAKAEVRITRDAGLAVFPVAMMSVQSSIATHPRVKIDAVGRLHIEMPRWVRRWQRCPIARRPASHAAVDPFRFRRVRS